MKGFYAKAFLLLVAFALLMNTAPACATPTDDIIESAAKESYVFKNYLHNDSIIIESNDGVVTLSGTAKNASARELATQVAQDVHGVRSVVNTMGVEIAE